MKLWSVLREEIIKWTLQYRKQHLTLYFPSIFRHKFSFTNIETCVDQPVGANIPDTSHTRWGRMEVESDNGIKKKKENNLFEMKDYSDRNKLGGWKNPLLYSFHSFNPWNRNSYGCYFVRTTNLSTLFPLDKIMGWTIWTILFFCETLYMDSYRLL